jgi:predicted transcriptional regulator of viral defense system
MGIVRYDMNKLTEKIFENAPYGYFTSQDVATMFPGSEDRRYSLVKRAIASGEIIHIRRGLYCLAPKYQKKKVNLYALGQHIYGPSYISLESALSWHGWIPEAVYTMTSVSLGKSKEFKTSLGVFSYSRVSQKVFYAGVEKLTDEAGNIFLMASPTKALTDYVYVHKKNLSGLKPVTESLRIEPDEFKSVTSEDLELLIENYTSRRVQKFIKGLKKDLAL